MASFGGDFDAKQFKEAFDTTDDMEAYNRVQALERAMGRVQNFDAEQAPLLKALLDDEDFRARASELVMGSIYEGLRDGPN